MKTGKKEGSNTTEDNSAKSKTGKSQSWMIRWRRQACLSRRRVDELAGASVGTTAQYENTTLDQIPLCDLQKWSEIYGIPDPQVERLLTEMQFRQILRKSLG